MSEFSMRTHGNHRSAKTLRPRMRSACGWMCGLAVFLAAICGGPVRAENGPDAVHKNSAISTAPPVMKTQPPFRNTAPKDINTKPPAPDAAPMAQENQQPVRAAAPQDLKNQPPVREAGAKEVKTQTPAPARDLEFNFHEVDIAAFIEFISKLTHKNFVLDSRVKGKVNIISPGRISVDEAYKVFQTVLDVHGFAAVQSGEIIKIIASPDARTQNIETRLKEEAISPEDKVVTQLIPLKYADAEEIKRLFAPLVSRSSVILAYQQTNMLILTDIYSNILRLMKILDAIDVTGIGREISIIPMKFADADKMAKVIETVFKDDPRAGVRKDVTERVMKFVADERTNSIILLASEADTERIKALIKELDREIPKGKEKFHVYYLENAKAEEMALVLQALPAKAQGGAPADATGKKEAPVVSRNVTITADKATNSLLIMAEKDEYLVLEDIIKQLDIRRSMVFIECLIMEVNVDKGFSLGTEWSAMGEGSYKGHAGAAGGGFSGSGQYDNISGMIVPNLLGVGALPTGFSMGVFGEPIEVGGIKFPTMAAMIQAYKKDKNVHILSTPQILTTDNQEAKIHVGKNIPYLTKIGTTTTTETYSNYEYKDVGITLKITPQISKDRRVRLDIAQEVQKLDQLSSVGTDRPSTLKRTIETTVIVSDKQTVVIGGLIDDSLSNTEYRVPCLGSIPLLGWLFKSASRTREKTNLFVFLTPRVIKSDEEAEGVYREKKVDLDRVKELSIKMYKDMGDKPVAVEKPADSGEEPVESQDKPVEEASPAPGKE